MKINKSYHSDHVISLKNEIKTKLKEELSPNSHDQHLKRKAEEAIECLDCAIVSVDILRHPDFNDRLDKRKNFYGLKLDIFTPNGHLIARNNQNIRKYLQMSMQMMNKKDMWKLFLSATLMELQRNEKIDLMLRVGSDHFFSSDSGSNDQADFIVAGPHPRLDFPLLIADIGADDSNFSAKKLQNMMTTTLVDMFNTRSHWPLAELVHLCVYGLIVRNEHFYVSKMALRPERGAKFAFVYTRERRLLPRSLFVNPKTEKTFNQEAWAQNQRGDADSSGDECFESESDEWITCYEFQTCHYANDKHLYDKLEDLCLDEMPPNNGAGIYRRPHGGAVTTIVSLMQTVKAKHAILKEKDRLFKHLKIN
jgi:hypothetical protein